MADNGARDDDPKDFDPKDVGVFDDEMFDDGDAEGVDAGASGAPERITLKAEITSAEGRALDPQRHDSATAREIAVDMCAALSTAYGKHEKVRPETLAVAVQTVLETLLSGIEREGVDAASMRVALANSLLVNGDASVEINVNGRRVPSILSESGSTVH